MGRKTNTEYKVVTFYDGEADPEDKYHLIIDEETAWAVRKIFDWAVEGHGSNYIRRRLEIHRLVKEILAHEEIDTNGKRHISIEIHFNFRSLSGGPDGGDKAPAATGYQVKAEVRKTHECWQFYKLIQQYRYKTP